VKVRCKQMCVVNCSVKKCVVKTRAQQLPGKDIVQDMMEPQGVYLD
jgi:hypothetical protein